MLKNVVGLVTGGASGLGKATVERWVTGGNSWLVCYKWHWLYFFGHCFDKVPQTVNEKRNPCSRVSVSEWILLLSVLRGNY